MGRLQKVERNEALSGLIELIGAIQKEMYRRTYLQTNYYTEIEKEILKKYVGELKYIINNFQAFGGFGVFKGIEEYTGRESLFFKGFRNNNRVWVTVNTDIKSNGFYVQIDGEGNCVNLYLHSFK